MRTIIIGAGVIGTLTAYHLARAGHEVTVIEKRGTAALGTSFANAAQLSYTYVEPMADPSILPKIPRWLVSRDAPVKVRFRSDYAMWKWCVQLLTQCTTKHFLANRDAILNLSMFSRKVMEEFLAEHDVAFDYSTTGKLHLYPDEESFTKAQNNAAYKQSLGYVQEVLKDKDACIAKEPALQHYDGKIKGGVFSPLDATGGAYQFSQAVLKLMEANHYSMQFKFDTECKRIITQDSKIQSVETDKGSFTADHYIVANGPEAPRLLKTIGIHVPIYPLKGYSVTFPLKHPESAPNISITDHGNRVVYARLGGRLRIAGGVELTGYDISFPPEKIERFNLLIKNNFPGVCDSQGGVAWAGLRPATPSGVPIIGCSKPYKNLFLNIGHGMLGWTLAQGSAKLISDIINKKQVVIDIFPYADR